MTEFRLTALILCMVLSACGVRQEEPEPGSAQAASSTSSVSTSSSSSGSTAGSTSTSASTNTDSDALADDEALENFEVVKLRFTNEYTGFWEDETRDDRYTTVILRITFGKNKYHLHRLEDQSSGLGARMENCYEPPSGMHTLRDLSEKGLWTVLNTVNGNGDPVNSENGWTLLGSQLQYTYYEEGVLKDSSTTLYKKVFEGLPVDGLPFCVD